MLPAIKLVSNHNGTYDIILEYTREDVEFAQEFDVGKNVLSNSKEILASVKAYAKKAKIASVKIFVSGILIATIAFSFFLSVFAAGDRYSMGYLYSGTDHQQIEYVNQTHNALDTVSPSYFDIEQDGSLKLNYLSEYLIETMHAKNIKVVPFLSNHWNRTAGINALQNVEGLSTQIADYVAQYNLDGVNVDIENVTHEQRDQYTQLVKLLREKIPQHKEVSVAVAANPNNWQTGWHGSYDYAALAQYADHLFIMAYDEHYEGGEAGPVAGIDFVERSVQYALTKTTPDKIVVGIPFYGRVWSLDNDRIVGKGVSSKTILDILDNCQATVTYDEASQSVKAEFKITQASARYTVGGDFVLQPGDYVVWFENEQSYEAKLDLVEKYDLKGVGSWSLGQEDPSIWEHYDSWLNGDAENATSPETNAPTLPEQTETPEVPETPETPENGESSTDPPVTEEGKDAWVLLNQTKVSVYKNANLKGKVVATLSGGDHIFVLEDNGKGVYRVRLSDGKTGYVSSSYITMEKQPDNTAPSEPSAEYFLYEVKTGDTLWKIAAAHLGSGSRYTEIMRINGLTSEVIYSGMQLKIPVSTNSGNTGNADSIFRKYTVKRGDTLWKIAKAQLGDGNRYTEIMELNNLTGTVIYSGQTLKLPKK
ncbi:MAG TPA: LysM peptidoglycan-binding domain-containing protein [Candidatus Scatavimonas merdigallinarum]|uniref:LysM peptidoglycan-binding domain-containing protein n=1 Tax=Candidatus Scatavimonas merdigallinarum TaxID=2840914 RepID=A0A9D0ZIC4_9FIRM|nr:LysM peptidoglycan-binding domain-containing protein [Candidatus Scatavimonas merdigallinarum]